MPITQAHAGQMADIAKNMEDIIARYQTSVHRIYQIGEEIDALWDGEAGKRFMAHMGQHRQNLDAMVKTFTEFSLVLRQNAMGYARAEQDAMDLIQRRNARY